MNGSEVLCPRCERNYVRPREQSPGQSLKAGDGLLEPDAVDRLGEAVAAQGATAEASVAADAEPSVLVSVEAVDVADRTHTGRPP